MFENMKNKPEKHNDKEQPACVLLAGMAWSSGIEIIRALGEQGVSVYVLSVNCSNSILRHSRYCKESVKIYAKNADELLRETLSWCEGQRFSDLPLLVPLTDFTAVMVAQKSLFYEKQFRVCSPAPQLVKTMVDKDSAGVVAQKYGLNPPRSMWIGGVDSLSEVVNTVRNWCFPVLVKPVSVTKGGGKTFKTKIYTEVERFADEIRDYLVNDTEFYVQEYVPGEDKSIVVYIFYRDSKGTVHGFTGRKIRQMPPGAGYMASGCSELLPTIKNISDAFLEKINFKGIGGLEYKLYNGSVYYIELNLRAAGFLTLSRKAGIDLSIIAYNDLVFGKQIPAKVQGLAYYLSTDAYILNFLRSKVKWKVLWEYIGLLMKPNMRLNLFSFRDPLPTLYWIIFRLKMLSGGVR